MRARDLTGLIRDLFVRRTRSEPAFGLTDDELVACLHAEHGALHAPTVKSARSRLTRSRPGWLVATGECRPSNTGHLMQVYALAPGRRLAVAS